MILYLDTSSLVKLYIDEPYSEEVWQWAGDAYALAASRVAYPEMLSALTHRYRNGDMDEATYHRTVGAFQRDWNAFAVVDSKKSGRVNWLAPMRYADLMRCIWLLP